MRRLILVLPVHKRKYVRTNFEDHIKKLINDHSGKDDLEVTTFDLLNGYIETQLFPKKGKPNKPIREIKHKAYYNQSRLPEYLRKNALSFNKQHVYDFIIKLGKENPGELYGVSLVGLYEEDYNKKRGMIIPIYSYFLNWETDYLHLLELIPDDFSIVKMGLINQQFFKNAFNNDAINFVFKQTSSSYPYNVIMSSIMGMNRFIQDDEEVDLKKIFSISEKRFIKLSVVLFLRVNFNITDFSKVKFFMIKSYICSIIKSQYALGLAVASGKTTYTYLPGIKIEDNDLYEITPAEQIKTKADNDKVCDFYNRYMGIENPIKDTFLQPILPIYKCKFPADPPINFTVIQTPEVKENVEDHYIFLIGVDYLNSKNKINFSKVCNSRLKEVVKTISRNTIFHVFDFNQGVKRTIIAVKNQDGSVKIKEQNPDEIDTYDPINFSKDYRLEKNEWGEDEYFFADISSSNSFPYHKRLSIMQFYTLLLKRMNGKVKQVCFISHGDEEGPVVYNQLSVMQAEKKSSQKTIQRSDFPEQWLDPHTSDLGMPLFGDSNLNTLRDVLAPDAIITSYGCNSNEIYLKLISSIINSEEYKEGNLSAESIITLHRPGIELRQFLKDNSFLKNKKEDSSIVLKWKYRLGDLLLFFKTTLASSYMTAFAYTSGHTVYGGLPGFNTYITQDEKNATIQINEYPEKYYKFYKRHFGFEKVKILDQDEKGLNHLAGYVCYDPVLPWITGSGLEGIGF